MNEEKKREVHPVVERALELASLNTNNQIEFAKIKKAHLRQGFGERRWSWRESNPRPNRQPISFLHA